MNNQIPNCKETVVARAIPTPDGLTQIVSLAEGWWECLDWLVVKKRITLQRITDFCWKYVQERPWEQFADIFNYFIHYHMMIDLGERYNLANDNFLNEKRVWEKKPPSYRIKLTKIPSFCAG